MLTDDYLERLVKTINKNQFYDGKYYVPLKSYSWIDTHQYPIVEGWPMPVENQLGDWRIFERSKYEDDDFHRLWVGLSIYTLPGLLLGSIFKNALFRASYDGIAREIPWPWFEAVGESPGRKYFNDTKFGLRVDKARLLHEVSGWNPYTIYKFTYHCLSKMLNSLERRFSDDHLEFYRECLQFIDAWNHFKHFKDETKYIQFYGKLPETRFYDELKKRVTEEIAPIQQLAISLKACYDPVLPPSYNALNRVALNTRTFYSFYNLSELHEKGYIKSTFFPKSEAEKQLAEKLWFTFAKQELSEQAAFLSQLL